MDSFQEAVLAIRLTRLDGWNVARAGRAAYHTELLECFSYSCYRIFPIQRAYVLDTLKPNLICKASITLCETPTPLGQTEVVCESIYAGPPLSAIFKSN